jgi:signal transduction histidine kinase
VITGGVGRSAGRRGHRERAAGARSAGRHVGRTASAPSPFRAGGSAVREPDAEARQWLARELHDAVMQTLTLMVVDIEALKRDQHGRRRTIDRLDGLQSSTRDVLANLRHVLYSLRDENDREAGFATWLCDTLHQFQECSGIAARVQLGSLPDEMSRHAARHLARIVQEALCNVAQHSGAQSVTMRLEAVDAALRLHIHDDGRGGACGEGMGSGMGVRGMAERATILGGWLTVDSQPGAGTTVQASFPLDRVR